MSKRVSKVGWIIMAALLCVSLAILPACGGGGVVNPTIPYKNAGIFVQDIIGDIDSLDPAWAYDTASGEQIQYMYDTLLFENYTGTDVFKPLLAENWTLAPNETQIRFYIRHDVHFSDNNTVTPGDVAYSIQRVMIQDRAGGPAWMVWGPLVGASSRSSHWGGNISLYFNAVLNAVQVDGDYVVFNFLPGAYPETAFLQILAQTWCSVLEKSWCVAHSEWDGTADNGTGNSTYWTKYNKPVKSASYLYNHAMGAGPWKLNNWNPGISITLDRNPYYWQGLAPFTSVITNFVDEWTTRKLDLQNGNADLVYVPRNYINELLNWTDLNKYSGLPDLTLDTIFYNFNITADSAYIGTGNLTGGLGIPTNFFADPKVRKAFCYAFDYNTYLTSVLMGEGTQMANPIVNGLFGYNASASKYSYNLTIAKQLFQSTTFFGNLSTTGFTFTLCYNSGNVPRKTACEMLQAAVLSIDPKFHISIQAISWPTYLDLIFCQTGLNPYPGSLPLFQIGWLVDYPDPDDFIAPYMEPESQGYAYSQGYGNSTISGLVEAARYMDNNPARLAIYNQLENIWYNDAPCITLFQTTARRFFTKYIHGFYFNPVYPGLPGPLYYMTKSNP